VAKKKKKAKHGKKGNLLERSEYNDDQPLEEDHETGGSSLIDFDTPSTGVAATPNVLDPFGFLNSPQPSARPRVEKGLLLPAEQGSGLELRGAFHHQAGQTVFSLSLANRSSAAMGGFMISFNKNAYRLKPVSTVIPVQVLNPGQITEVDLPLSSDGEAAAATSSAIQVAVKNNVSVFYMTADCPLFTFFGSNGALPKAQYLQLWAELEATEQASMMQANGNVSQIISSLQSHNVFLIAQKNLEQDVLYLSTNITVPGVFGGEVALVELTIKGVQCKCCVRTSAPLLVPLLQNSIALLVA